MTKLILAEKPQAAKKISYALSEDKPEFINKRGAYWLKFDKDGEEIIVAPAVGHLFTLDQKGEGWDYPVFDVEWVETFKKDKSSSYAKKYYYNLKEVSEKADEIIVGTDYDQEGDAIAALILRFIFKQDNAERMKFSTLTVSELNKSYEERLNSMDKGQVNAGLARHKLDYFWGINNSRALIKAVKSNDRYQTLSIGRVQGPTLKILAEKEREIQKFEPEPYWHLKAKFDGSKGKLNALHENKRFKSEEKVDNVEEKCKGSEGEVAESESSKFKSGPFPPFNLGDLQSESYSAFGFSPSKTLKIAQSLYDNGYISYPRTDSQKIPPSIGYKSILKGLKDINTYEDFAEEILDQEKLSPRQGKKDDPAHPAIYPTGTEPEDASEDEKKVYDLIARRFISCFGKPAIRKKLTLEIIISQEIFKTSGKWTIKQNWMKFYKPYLRYKENELPEYDEGDRLEVLEIEKIEKETQPPRRYSQSSIIKKMEKLNLGTKATRSEVIKKLFKRDYIDGNSIEVTDLGLAVIDTLKEHCPEIISVELTKKFQKDLEKIREGKKDKEEIISEAKEDLSEVLEKFRENEKKIGAGLIKAIDETRRKKRELGTCDECGGTLKVIKTKNGQFVGCSNYPDCDNSYPLPGNAKIISTDKTCDKCGTPKIKVVRKGKRPFTMCLDPDCPTKDDWGSDDD